MVNLEQIKLIQANLEVINTIMDKQTAVSICNEEDIPILCRDAGYSKEDFTKVGDGVYKFYPK